VKPSDRAAVISEREYRAIWRRALVEVDVLAALLATAVRSHAPVSPASARLAAAVDAIPGRFRAIMAPLVARPSRQARR
jgi:hypothetical protein